MSVDTNVIVDDQIAYKERTWGKKVDGENVIDGYNFKGGQHFKKTKEKLEQILKRGTKGEIDGLEFQVLDRRKKGIELEMDIEVSENSRIGVDSRGVAVAKLYGPNKKKENTVTVTKSKESDVKFVTILDQKTIVALGKLGALFGLMLLPEPIVAV